MNNKTEEFIKKAKKIHGDRYDYSKVEYNGVKRKISILCKIHGIFEQRPDIHLAHHGCKYCSIKSRAKIPSSLKLSTEQFIDRAKKIHGDRYDYSKVVYQEAHTKVIIICPYHGKFEQTANSHYKHGCAKCGANRLSLIQRSNTQEFIQKALKIHNNKYDYSKVDYISNSKNIIIICSTHGEFNQTPSSHLSGRGCYLCGRESTITSLKSNTDEFIQKALKVHGDRYDYSNVEYVNRHTNITIICANHGPFIQKPASHLSGGGCHKCAKECCIITTDEFIKNAKKIHGEKYDYSKTIYIRRHLRIIIACSNHGIFQQTPNDHMSGNGCQKCGRESMIKKQSKTTKQFIEQSKLFWGNDKYDYSNVYYINSKTKVLLICKKHGEFKQNPNSHLRSEGCSKCCGKTYSKAQIEWLEFLSKLHNIKIQHALNDGEHRIKLTRWKADGYCKETNTVYEYHGDYWHGNPKLYDPEFMNTVCKRKMKTLYDRTIKREQKIKELGYNLEVIWESDWNKIINSVKTIQRAFRSTQN